MRRLLALGCCALYLVFGFVAGAAHLHESADHHVESRGLHLDHAHPGDTVEHRHDSPHDDDSRLGAGHVEHHQGDAFYLTATALRSLESKLRSMPATVRVGVTIEAPSTMPYRNAALAGPPRDPPQKRPTRTRAPPA